jgi:hypothetical protein
LDASFLNGLSTNQTNQLNTLRLQSSFAYGSDNRVVLTGLYFDTWGTSDALLYAGIASGFSPNSPSSGAFFASILRRLTGCEISGLN